MADDGAWSTTGWSNVSKVDSRLTSALKSAAKSFAKKNPGYRVVGFSGKKARRSGTKWHPSGVAIDVDIVGPNGRALENYRNAKTFRAYEALAHEFRTSMDAAGLKDIGRWGGYFGGRYAFDQMHFDLGPRNDMNMGDWENGLNATGKKALPGAESFGMAQFSEQAAQTARNEAVAHAYRDPMRALDVVPPQAPSVPRGAINAGIRGLTKMSPSFGTTPYADRYASLASRPASLARSTFTPENIDRSLTGANVPTAPTAPSVAPRAAVDAALDGPLGLSGGSLLGASTARNVAAMQAQADLEAAQAAQYAGFEAQRAKAFSALPGPAPAAPPSVPAGALPAAPPTVASVAPPTVAPVAPAAVLAPALTPPTVVKDYNVAEFQAPPQAPRATAYDVYSGIADTALDNTGKNNVSRDAFGNTTVTNPYGATTAMTPQGYQSAYGSMPSLPGVKAPSMGKFGTAVKGAIPSIGGGILGSALFGPLGGIIGAALAKAVTQPGGLLSNVNSFPTEYFGQLNAAEPQGGGAFPDAPSGGYGSGGRMGASFSNRSRNEMNSISPGASRAIGQGKGGLY